MTDVHIVGTQSHWRFQRPVTSASLGDRRWEGGDPGVSNQKTPTTILLTPERKFHSFGYAARDFYHDLDPNEAKQWLYLEKFKMKLHTTGVSWLLKGSKGPQCVRGLQLESPRFLPNRN